MIEGSPAQWIALTAWAVVAAGYLVAIYEWGRMSPGETESTRRPALVWTAAAVVLVALMGALAAFGLGFGAFIDHLATAGFWMLLKAAGLLFLIQAGAVWARRAGFAPFRLRGRPWREWPWRWLGLAWLAMVAWTALMMLMLPAFGRVVWPRMQWLEALPDALLGALAFGLLSLAPILEEALFRHYLLYRLRWMLRAAPRAGLWAVVLTSALWSLLHVGHIEPVWIKWLQVFVPGLLLGATALRWGLEPAILLHWLFNLSMIPLAWMFA